MNQHSTAPWTPGMNMQTLATANAALRREVESLRSEVAAWRERFPDYIYRPQDDCVALRMEGARRE